MNVYDWVYHSLVKQAALRRGIQLRPHQEDAIRFIEEHEGRGLLAHGTGTGKTLSSIATFEKLKKQKKAKKALVIVPAALKTNFIEHGVHKFTTSSAGSVGSGKQYEVISLERFRRDPEAVLDQVKPDTVIVDEIHRAKNPGSQSFNALNKIREDPRVKNFIGLTGSMVSNHPRDIVPLLDIIQPEHEFGTRRKFTRQYVETKQMEGGFLRAPKYQLGLKDTTRLGEGTGKLIHYIDHDDIGKDGLPRINVEDVHVEMSPEQTELYNFALGRLNPLTRAKIRYGLPATQSEAQEILPQIIRARQAANSIGTHKRMSRARAAEQTPKMKRIMDDVEAHLKKTKDGQAVVYTNMVEGGAQEMAAGLRKRGISTGIYSGADPRLNVTRDSRDQDVRDFLGSRKRAIVITPAGGEGLSLNNATFFAATDHHFNPEKNWQAVARARRFGGLAHRKPEHREVQVNRYYSDPRPGFIGRLMGRKDVGVDEWIQRIANEKDRVNEELRAITKKGRQR